MTYILDYCILHALCYALIRDWYRSRPAGELNLYVELVISDALSVRRLAHEA